MAQFFRVKFTHRPHYNGFIACTFHARALQSSAVEVTEVSPADLLPLPAHKVAAGATHCNTCNREKGLLSVPPTPAVAEG